MVNSLRILDCFCWTGPYFFQFFRFLVDFDDICLSHWIYLEINQWQRIYTNDAYDFDLLQWYLEFELFIRGCIAGSNLQDFKCGLIFLLTFTHIDYFSLHLEYFAQSHSPMQNRLPLPSNHSLNASMDSEDGGWASFSGEVFAHDPDASYDQDFDGSPRLMRRR